MILFDLMYIYPITFEPLNFGDYVIKGLCPTHSSFYIELHWIKLKLRFYLKNALQHRAQWTKIV